MKVVTPMIFSIVSLVLAPVTSATTVVENKTQRAVQVKLFKEHDDILQRHFEGSALQFSAAIPLEQRAIEFHLSLAEASAQGQVADLKYDSVEVALRHQFFSANSMKLLTESLFNHISYSGSTTHSYNQYGAGLVGRDYWGEKLQVEVRLGYLGASGAAPSAQKGLYTEARLSYPVTSDLALYMQWSSLGKRDITAIGAEYRF